MADVKKYMNFIDGKWTAPTTNEYYDNINPANRDDVIGKYPLSAKKDVDTAIDSCQRAFKVWSKMLVGEREKIINKFVELLDANKQKIGEMLTREQGKTLKEALGEPTRGVVECRYFMGEGTRLEGITMPSDRPGVMSVAQRVPLGVVAAIAPWNFPFLTPLRKIMPALVCGNTVIFKPAFETPQCGVMLMELFEQAGLPAGVVNMVIGKGSVMGDAISSNPLVRGITFTGSTGVGQRINETAAKNFTKVQLEMGGKNPSVVANYSKLAAAAKQLAGAAYALAGQRCTSISRVIVLEDQAEEFENYLAEETTKFVMGDGMDPKVTIGPVMNQKACDDILGYIQSAKDEGATIRVGGKQLTGGIYDKSCWIEPTLITNVTPKMKVAIDEIFGPVLVVLRAKNFEEAVAMANDTKYGLASSIFTDDLDKIYYFVQEIESGMVHINHGTVTDGTMPFGGVKQSGIGQFSKGKTNKDFFTQYKVVYTKYV
ncbi:MAG: aldehyde dehydrogenase family protein [Planctomycetaceae bacterium]|nr:aldehyde dehydrogenase family protein [Planctomycetaceae bacterium]